MILNNSITRHRALTMLALSVFLFCSCAQKVYFQDARKIDAPENINRYDDIQIESYFSGDALDYLVFELDLFNNGSEDVRISRKDISLHIIPVTGSSYILNPLHKADLIRELERRHKQAESDRKTNNIINAVGIGLDLLVIGTSGGSYAGIDAAIFATESAAYALEENRAFKLLSGSLEEQIEYVNQWVLDQDTIKAGEEYSWDILFERSLIDADAEFRVVIDNRKFSQLFNLNIREEKVR